jgi:glycosyltransferase involved in cell wall biosynthesis
VTSVSSGNVRIVGSVLVRNEDVFVERAIRNALAFCDRIHVVDHRSTDRTWAIVRTLATEFDVIDTRRAAFAGDSHRVLEQYAGTRTWVLGIDGDELFDPVGLARLRAQLLAGAHDDVFRLKAHVLNCDEIDDEAGLAHGYLAPPSRPITKLFNFAAVESWHGAVERLHSGEIVFRQGFDWESRRDLAETSHWETDDLRCLHTCFLARSSRDVETEIGWRRNLDETREFRRGMIGGLVRLVRRPALSPGAAKVAERSSTWKREWYCRGERVAVDARPFLAPPGVDGRGA